MIRLRIIIDADPQHCFKMAVSGDLLGIFSSSGIEPTEDGRLTGEVKQETGGRRCEKGDVRPEAGDVRQETGDRRSETGDVRQEKREARCET